jgi:hypothetical protein
MHVGRQAGMSIAGWLIVLALIGFFSLAIIKLFPMYFEYYQVKEILDDIARDKDINHGSKEAVWGTLVKRLDISSAYSGNVRRENLKLERKKEGVYLSVKYEDRRPFMGNLDVVGTFDYSVMATP